MNAFPMSHLRYDDDASNLLHSGVVRRRHAVQVARDLRPQVRHRDELINKPRAKQCGTREVQRFYRSDGRKKQITCDHNVQ